MNAEIARTQRCILELYHQQHSYLAGKPRQFVEDLLHESEHVKRDHQDFSARTAAEINRTACNMILKEAKP